MRLVAVRVVTDSTADLPLELAQRWGIVVVPLNLHFGQQVYRDGVDLSADAFYQKLVASPSLPTTSQPSIGAFLETYHLLVEQGDQVVSVHISSKLSGTYNSALRARQELPASAQLETVDSQQGSMGLGLIVLQAARAAAQGGSLEQVVRVAKEAIGRVHFFGLVDTLEYLQKGGRIGKAQAFLGALLRVKPLITCREGEVHPLERAHSRARGVQRLEELVRELAPVQDLGVIHSTTPDEAHALAGRLRSLTAGDVVVSQVGPVVGTYLGPGVLGVAVCRAR